LNNVIEIYKKYNVKYYIEETESKASRKLGKNKHKFYYSIVVKKFDHLLVLLNKLDEKLIGKQRQLELMVKYIQKKKADKHYTDEVYSIVAEVKKLNNHY